MTQQRVVTEFKGRNVLKESTNQDVRAEQRKWCKLCQPIPEVLLA